MGPLKITRIVAIVSLLIKKMTKDEAKPSHSSVHSASLENIFGVNPSSSDPLQQHKKFKPRRVPLCSRQKISTASVTTQFYLDPPEDSESHETTYQKRVL